MDRLANLSRREREIMEIVFSLGKATVTEIRDRIHEPPTRPALRSLLGILEEKGRLDHHKKGREFVYRTTESRERVGRSVFEKVVKTFFGGSLEQAVASYLSDPAAELSTDELDELATSVKQARQHRAEKLKPKGKTK